VAVVDGNWSAYFLPVDVSRIKVKCYTLQPADMLVRVRLTAIAAAPFAWRRACHVTKSPEKTRIPEHRDINKLWDRQYIMVHKWFFFFFWLLMMDACVLYGS